MGPRDLEDGHNSEDEGLAEFRPGKQYLFLEPNLEVTYQASKEEKSKLARAFGSIKQQTLQHILILAQGPDYGP